MAPSCVRPPLSASRKRGACGSSVKSSSVKFASTPPVADSCGQDVLKNCGTCERGTRIGALNTSFAAGGKPSGDKVWFCQTQSPTIAKGGCDAPVAERDGDEASPLLFSASRISPFASNVARSGSLSGVFVTVTTLVLPSVMFSC